MAYPAFALPLLALASALLGCASTVLLLRAIVLRHVRATVAATVAKTAGDVLGAAREALAKDATAAADALTQLRSERGRVMALIRHRGSAGGDADDDGEGEGEPDRLDRLLGNPVVQGFLQAKGFEPSMLAALADGDPSALLAMKAKLGGDGGAAADDAGLL